MGNDQSRPIFNSSDPTTWSPLLTIEQTAQILNISPWTLRQWDKLGKLVPIRVGSRKDRRYKKEELLKILDVGLN